VRDTLKPAYQTLDRIAGAGLGVLAAAAAAAVTPAGAAMVPVMATGMVLGMTAAMGGAFLIAPWAGMFEIMIPGMWAGMVAGMSGGMARAMDLPWSAALTIGAGAGLAIVLAFQRLDARLTRGEDSR